MRTIVCPVCNERRAGVRVCPQCYHRLNRELGGTEWLDSGWFKEMERQTWREQKRELADRRYVEEYIRLGADAFREKSRYERAVALLQAGRAPTEVRRILLAGTEGSRGQRNKVYEAVKRALDFLGETYQPAGAADFAHEFASEDLEWDFEEEMTDNQPTVAA